MKNFIFYILSIICIETLCEASIPLKLRLQHYNKHKAEIDQAIDYIIQSEGRFMSNCYHDGFFDDGSKKYSIGWGIGYTANDENLCILLTKSLRNRVLKKHKEYISNVKNNPFKKAIAYLFSKKALINLSKKSNEDLMKEVSITKKEAREYIKHIVITRHFQVMHIENIHNLTIVERLPLIDISYNLGHSEALKTNLFRKWISVWSDTSHIKYERVRYCKSVYQNIIAISSHRKDLKGLIKRRESNARIFLSLSCPPYIYERN